MYCWTATDARPGLPRVDCAVFNVANSFKISTCSWLLWGPRSRARLSLPNGLLCMSIPAVATRARSKWPPNTEYVTIFYKRSVQWGTILTLTQAHFWKPLSFFSTVTRVRSKWPPKTEFVTIFYKKNQFNEVQSSQALFWKPPSLFSTVTRARSK